MTNVPRKAEETFSVRLTKSLATEVRTIAASENNGASSVIRRLISRAIATERPPGRTGGAR